MVDAPSAQSHLPVTVLLRITPTPEHPWLDERVETLAVLPVPDTGAPDPADGSAAQAVNDGSIAQTRLIRVDGMAIDLHPDEAESYYFNLMVDEPRCFVVFQSEDGERPVPFVVTPSFDLAASYEEGDLRVDAVTLDPGLLQPIESFVLQHYLPEKKVKRKRRNWSAR